MFNIFVFTLNVLHTTPWTKGFFGKLSGQNLLHKGSVGDINVEGQAATTSALNHSARLIIARQNFTSRAEILLSGRVRIEEIAAVHNHVLGGMVAQNDIERLDIVIVVIEQ